MSASPTIAASAFTSHRETVAQATPAAPRLEDVLALVDRLAPADRARLREELRVRYDAAGQPEGVVGASPPHRLRH